MSLAPFPRRVARVPMPSPLRWADMPSGAVRQVTLDSADWADQVPGDPPTTLTASVTPADGGLTATAPAVDGNVLEVTLTAGSGGIGKDYLVLLTASTAGGRVEPYATRVLVTSPAG